MSGISKYKDPMIQNYKQCCKDAGKKLSRDEYRKVGG